MAKVTSKLQLTIPKAIAEQYKIRPGDELDWLPAGKTIRVVKRARSASRKTVDATLQERLRLFDQATARQQERNAAFREHLLHSQPSIAVGRERNFTIVAFLVDTHVLVYRFDARYPDKQRIARDVFA